MACHFVSKISRWIAAPLFSIALVAAAPANAATQNVRLMMDWLVQGTHTPFILAQAKGYFKDEGLSATIDSGKGATNVAVSIAGGAYQFGLVDFPALVKFDAHNPKTPLVAVYIYFDTSPLAIISLKSKPILTPAELNNKRIAGGPGTAAYDTIGLLIKPSDHVKIHWVPAEPQLFAPLLLRHQVDGIGAFINSTIPAAVQVGIKEDDLVTLPYARYGVNPYGLALVTTKALIEKDPELVKKVVKVVNRGLIETIESPDASLKYLLARDPLLNSKIEKLRLKLALELIDTPNVRKHGLSSATPQRLLASIDAGIAGNNIPKAQVPTISQIYTDAFLPPLADRMLK